MRLLRSGILLVAMAVWLAGACAADADKLFEVEGCPYCRKMRQQVLSREDVQVYFRKHFAIFSVDAFGDVPITDFSGKATTEKVFARNLKIRGTPSFVVFGAGGRELARLSGATKDAAEFMQFGRYIGDGHYKSLSLEQYLAAARAQK